MKKEEIKDKFVCMECDEEMKNVDASDEIKKMYKVGEDGARVVYLMCKDCAMRQY